MESTYELNQQGEVVLLASALIVEVEKEKGNVSQFLIKSMESYKLPLLQIVAKGGMLKDYAMHTLNSLNAAIEYANGNKGARNRMISEFKASDRIAERISKELRRSGN